METEKSSPVFNTSTTEHCNTGSQWRQKYPKRQEDKNSQELTINRMDKKNNAGTVTQGSNPPGMERKENTQHKYTREGKQ